MIEALWFVGILSQLWIKLAREGFMQSMAPARALGKGRKKGNPVERHREEGEEEERIDITHLGSTKQTGCIKMGAWKGKVWKI